MESLGAILQRIVQRKLGAYPAPEPVEVCPKCKGSGFVSRGLRPDYSHDVVPCSCLAVGLKDGFQTFEGDNSPDLVVALAAAMSWVDRHYEPILVLSGPPGVGKTHLARAALSKLAQIGHFPVWLTDAQLVDQIFATFNRETFDGQVLKSAQSAPWFILDDLGATARPESVESQIDRIIDLRYQGALTGRLRTLITTNVGGDSLSARTTSRLKDSAVSRIVVIDAPDYRQHRGRVEA